jgi:hypothetical protein
MVKLVVPFVKEKTAGRCGPPFISHFPLEAAEAALAKLLLRWHAEAELVIEAGSTHTELRLGRLSCVCSQVLIMPLLVTTVVSRMVGLRACLLVEALVLVLVLVLADACRELGAEAAGDVLRSEVGRSHAKLRLGRLSCIRSQVLVVTLLVTAVVRRVVLLSAHTELLCASCELIAEAGRSRGLAVLGLHITDRLVLRLKPAVLGGHRAGSTKLILEAVLLKSLIVHAKSSLNCVRCLPGRGAVSSIRFNPEAFLIVFREDSFYYIFLKPITFCPKFPYSR